MNLKELKDKVEEAIKSVKEYGDDPEKVIISIQIESPYYCMFSTDVELHYDCDIEYSGCVIIGEAD